MWVVLSVPPFQNLTGGFVLNATNIVDKLALPAKWETLPTYASTIVELHADDRSVIDMPAARKAWEAKMEKMARGEEVPEEPVRVRTIMLCYFLGKLVRAAEPHPLDYARFGKVIADLVDAGIVRGKLADPCFIPLSKEIPRPDGGFDLRPPTCLMLAYLFVDVPHVDDIDEARRWLNKRIGFEAFTQEGTLPIEWPEE